MKEKYVNFMGTPGNYRFYPPMPNPSNLRGNPDTFSWAMNRGGDGLNASRKGADWSHFTGEVQDDSWLYSRFANQNGDGDSDGDGIPDTIDSSPYGDDGSGNVYAGPGGAPEQELNWWQRTFGGGNRTDEERQERREQFWGNLGANINTFAQGFGSGYSAGTYQPSDNPLLQPPGPINTNNPNTNPNTSGPGSDSGNNNTILWVVGGLGVTAIIIALISASGRGRQAKGGPEFMQD